MMRAPIVVDASRWIRVPLQFEDERWPDADAWAGWVAAEALPRAPEKRPRVAAIALAIARLPAAGVNARYWHYPETGEPGPAVDIAVSRPDEPRLLLPASPRVIVEPLERSMDLPGFAEAARRRSLVAVGDEPEGSALAVVEWAAAVDGIVVDMMAVDTDPARLSRLVDDADVLLAGIDGRALAPMVPS